MDEFLSSEAHCQELKIKLSREFGMLAEDRHYVPHEHLINLYHAIFAYHMMYGAQIWTPKILISVSDTVSRI